MRAKRNFYKITSELVEKMQSMRREGATFKFIAEELGINQSTVYAHVKKENKIDAGFSNSKYIVILEGIKAGKKDEEIIKDAKTTMTYLRQVKSFEANRKKEAEEEALINQKEKEEKSPKNKKLGERREEVRKLMEEVERQKKKQEKEWEEEKMREIAYQVEAYPYAFK